MAKKDRKQIRKWHKIIEESGKFDKVYYLKQNPDVRKSWDDPIEHYLLYGAEEGRDPNAWFDSDFYLSMYSDVGESGINPFVHYLLYGVQEGRVCKQDAVKNENKTLETGEWMQTEPVGREWTEAEKESYKIIDGSGLFDEQWYFDTYEEARRDPRGGLEHYIEIGQYRGDNPTKWFDAAYYMETYPDVRESGQNPFVHYLLYGKEEGRLPRATEEMVESKTTFGREWTEEEKESYKIIDESGLFDEQWYLDTYEDARRDPRGGLEHYIEIGQYNRYKPTKWFDVDYYLKNYPEADKNRLNLFAYYIDRGKEEGHSTEEVVGNISDYGNGKIRGWCYSNDEEMKLLLMVGNKPCTIIKDDISMPNVAKKYGFEKDNVGFIAKVEGDIHSENDISLYALYKNRCCKVTSTNKFIVNNVSPRIISKLNLMETISRKKDSIAIVVWDVTHNPVGRAKVLYDIVKTKHPVMMIGFDFGFSKSEVWEPLKSNDMHLTSIKWEEREIYTSLIKEIGIVFDTVWICKPRLPSYVLADMISDEESKFILDIDDNEKAMSQSAAALPKPYGAIGNNLAENFTNRIKVKSVASISIKEKWGGELVRHARSNKIGNISSIKTRKKSSKTKIGFFGTVRPHKNIHKAAKAINELKNKFNISIEFHVGGHFFPETLRSDIEKYGAVTYGTIPSDQLHKIIDNMDILITGFPLDEEKNEITKYQISSKIADALSMGKPVLVPKGSSVKDLENIEGIFLFDENDFSSKLMGAINLDKQISLPDIFSFDYNYEVFKELRYRASQFKKSKIFDIPLAPKAPYESKKYPKTLVLLWKQPDSTIYGRRIDQIARSYKRKFPDHRVIVIEGVEEGYEKNLIHDKDFFTGDSSIILGRIVEKRNGLIIEGIEHLVFGKSFFEGDQFRNFLLARRILPGNTLFILFPIVSHFKNIFTTLQGYKYVADIVDNQLGWKQENPHKIVEQYKILTAGAYFTIFNSDINRNYFFNHGMLKRDDKNILIPNWYELPKNFCIKQTNNDERGKKIFYSGNMNDRIDWNLIDELLYQLPEGVTLYLIGNALRAAEALKWLLSRHNNCQFLGPMDERNLISFARTCCFSIMPHTVESTSKFMNPLKVHMFAALGIDCISTDVPGLEHDLDNLFICKNRESFIVECLSRLKKCDSIQNRTVDLQKIYKKSRDIYLKSISNLL